MKCTNQIVKWRQRVTLPANVLNLKDASDIWTSTRKYCFLLPVGNYCKPFCFYIFPCDPKSFLVFDELLSIHCVSNLHKTIGDVANFVETRRKGVGESHIAFVTPSWIEREVTPGTEQQKNINQPASVVEDILLSCMASRTPKSRFRKPSRKLCSLSICSLLGVSKKVLCGRKKTKWDGLSGAAKEDEAENHLVIQNSSTSHFSCVVVYNFGIPSLDSLEVIWFDCTKGTTTFVQSQTCWI